MHRKLTAMILVCGMMAGMPSYAKAAEINLNTNNAEDTLTHYLPEVLAKKEHGELEFASAKIESTGLNLKPLDYSSKIEELKDILQQYDFVDPSQMRTSNYSVYDEKMEILIQTLCQFCHYENPENVIDDAVLFMIENLQKLSADMLHDIHLSYLTNLQINNRDGTLHKNGKANPYYLFMQTDPEWAKLPYPCAQGGSQTIAGAACGPVAMSTILSSYFHKEILPTELSDFSVERGHRYSTGTASSLFSDAANQYGMPKPVECYRDSVDAMYDGIKNQGHMVIALMGRGVFTGGGHYVVLVGTEERNGEEYFLVSDPNFPNRHYSSTSMIDDNPSDSFILAKKDIFKTQMKKASWFQCNFHLIHDSYKTQKDEILLKNYTEDEFLETILVGVSQDVKEDTLHHITKNKTNDNYKEYCAIS